MPLDADLVIQARVRPQDIDSVRIGQSASVRLTALNKRTTPMVEGRVTYVSADALPARTGARGDRARTASWPGSGSMHARSPK